ncbi:MAG TPA: EscU/YscU/HrcU family type III secretion system export apparatus switch protein [Desulfotomaculum sp.]|nr:MAG: flagellar biosynthesis protein FlhB [Peptococcaceae bacterium BRH_c8a]KJS76622.1 MAG: flagellar biosynthesis protein FlhB [Desulfotomaculum sp. BICA1-6]HBX23690.1 EscU/YscU/HrcU family type III secretion system export apparatus switch protein [Desulfotomaculum sp.]
MADNNSAQQKTEPPSPKKLSDARKKGQVPKSRDLSAALILLAALATIALTRDNIVLSMERLLLDYFRAGMTVGLPAESLPYQGFWFLARMGTVLLPLFAVIMAMSVAANVAQVGVMFSPQVLQPKMERLNPAQGIKRIFSLRSLFELAKNLIKVIIVAAAVYLVIKSRLPEMLLIYFKTPAQLIELIAEAMLIAAFTGGGAFLVVSVFDLMFQRYEHTKNLRMTKQEVKDEMKQTEGDPQVKSWLRRRQREIIVNAIRREVPRATVVITNPTHLAVAVRYDEKEMPAPMVTAKGAGDLVQVMKRLARQNKVAVVENPPVARTLYKNVEVGQEIPMELYQAIAEVIAMVYKLKGKAV